MDLEPGARSPAPGSLRLVQAFLNTTDLEAGTDAFATSSGLRGWLRGQGLGDEARAAIPEVDRSRIVAVREALRELVGGIDGEPVTAAAQAVLARAAERAPLVVRLDPALPELVPAAAGADAVVARVLGAVAIARADGSWARLKTCRNDVCRWAFFDASRNRSGHWCSMAVCGNRLKGRAFRARRRVAGPSAALDQRRKVRPQVPSQTT